MALLATRTAPARLTRSLDEAIPKGSHRKYSYMKYQEAQVHTATMVECHGVVLRFYYEMLGLLGPATIHQRPEILLGSQVSTHQ